MKINLVIILLLSQIKYSLGIVMGRYMIIVLAVLPLNIVTRVYTNPCNKKTQ